MRSKALKIGSLVLMLAILVFSVTPYGESFWISALKHFNLYSVKGDDSEISVHFLDVGKADSILINHNKEFVLIDGATCDQYENISNYLDKCGVSRLYSIIISHLDKDHIGSLAEIIENYSVDNVYMVKYPEELIPSSDEYEHLITAIKENGLLVTYLEADDSFVSAEINFSVLSPSQNYDNINDMSLVVKAEFKDFSALFVGDAGKATESQMIEEGRELKADILKVGHHGSNDSSSSEFLNAVSPKAAVISCGEGTDNLPGFKALQRLEENGCKLFRTDKSGTITISSDCDGTYKVYTEK